jgi:hypothetical protein
MSDNVFSLEVLRARKGDCLMLHYGTTDEPALALVDGGPGGVYQPFLRPRLEALRAERGLSDEQPLLVDLCMLSHIDDDHVVGLIGLTKELVEADDANKPKLVQILDLWHNSFDDIVGNDAEELAGAVQARFGPASLSGDLPPDVDANVDSVMVLASIPKGRRLRDDAAKLGIERNLDTDGELIVASAGSQPLDMGNGLTLTVVGPMLAEIQDLQKDHAKWVRDNPDQARRSGQALASYDDGSVPNLSSIVVLAEAGGKTILFTGDARGDKILEGLELVGLLEPGGAMHVDVLKCPHHGSINNVEQDLFERITADHYVFSGNGEHGNPDRETLELLVSVRGDEDYRIHLTYPLDAIDVERKQHWQTHHDEPWSPDKHSLTAFFADNPTVNDKVVVVEKDVPHTIELLG